MCRDRALKVLTRDVVRSFHAVIIGMNIVALDLLIIYLNCSFCLDGMVQRASLMS